MAQTDSIDRAAPVPDAPLGYVFALSAYVLWGFLPLYMKAVAHIPALEVLAHRIIWATPVAGAVLIALGRTADLTAALRNPRMLGMAAVTAALISVNWAIYIYAIVSGQALEAALGYYINPLFSVVLGWLVLGERLSPMKWAAVALATGAVVVLTVAAGGAPLIALSLTLTFGAYAYFKKSLPIGPNQGFLLEVLILTPAALAYAAWLAVAGGGHFLTGPSFDTLMLMGAGVVTAVPLMCYANGAKLLRLSTIGMLQYLAPTMIFLVAVFIFDEPFGPARAVAFPMIWLAVALYSLSLLRDARRAPAR